MRKSTILGLTAGFALTAGIVFAATANTPAAQAEDGGYVLSIDPVNGSVLSEISTVTITFNGRIGVNDMVRPAVASLENTTTGDSWYCYSPDPVFYDAEGNACYTLRFSEDVNSFPVTVSQPGEYTLTLRGFMLNDEDYLEPMTFNYTIGDYPVEYSLNPAGGSTVSNLSKVSLTFPNNVVECYVGKSAIATLENLDNGDAWYCFDPNAELIMEPGEDAGVVYNFTFYAMGEEEVAVINAPGNYQLTVKALYTGTLDEAGEIADTYDLPVITANYTIAYPVEYTLDPEPGPWSVKDLTEVTLTFPNNVVEYYPGKIAVATLENLDNGDAWYCYTPQTEFINMEPGEEPGIVYTFKFYAIGEDEVAVIDAPGNYQLTVKALYTGTLDEDGELADTYDLPVITANYTIDYPVAYELSPAAGVVEEISEIVITFAEGTNVGFYDVHPAVASLENVETGEVLYCEIPAMEDRAKVPTYTLKFTELGGTDAVTVNQPGKYVLTIRGAYQTIIGENDAEENIDLPVINANYTIPYPVAYTLVPESGANVEDLTMVTLTFPSNLVAYYDNVRPAVVTLENTTTGEVWYSSELQAEYIMDEGEEGIEYTFSFYELGNEEEAAIINAPGQYLLSIRGLYTGTLDEDGELADTTDLPVINANYTIPYPVAYTLVPGSGSNVESIKTVTITFEEKVGFVENPRGNEILLENTITGAVYVGQALQKTKVEGGAEYDITFYEEGDYETAVEITEMGNYVLRLYGFYQGSVDEDGEEVQEPLPLITANYTIPYPVAYTLVPDSGAYLESIDTVTITFEEKVGFEGGMGNEILLENTTTGAVYTGVASRNTFAMTEGAEYDIKFYELGDYENPLVITETGHYVLRLYGFSTEGEDGEPNVLPLLVADYTIVFPVNYTLSPADGTEVEELSEVILTFPNDPLVGIQEVRPAPVSLENLTTGNEWVCENPMKGYTDEGGAMFTITFSEQGSTLPETITEEGEYLLTVRGLYTTVMDEEENETNTDLPYLTATYLIVNGTTSIDQFIDADTYNVYGINGVQVIRNGKASDLNSLNPGLYIINGKKVLIRK